MSCLDSVFFHAFFDELIQNSYWHAVQTIKDRLTSGIATYEGSLFAFHMPVFATYLVFEHGDKKLCYYEATNKE